MSLPCIHLGKGVTDPMLAVSMALFSSNIGLSSRTQLVGRICCYVAPCLVYSAYPQIGVPQGRDHLPSSELSLQGQETQEPSSQFLLTALCDLLRAHFSPVPPNPALVTKESKKGLRGD